MGNRETPSLIAMETSRDVIGEPSKLSGPVERAIIVEKTQRAAKCIDAGLRAERAHCAHAAKAEKVDYESTKEPTDEAYNRACDDVVNAIYARNKKESPNA